MGLIVFPALVSEADAADLQARFPDFPDVSVRAATPVELLLRARERLTQALRDAEKAGDGWPAPSSLAEARASAGASDTMMWVDVEVEDAPVRVTISIGERLLARIDAAAEEHAMTRSGYLAAAARRQIAVGGSPLDGPMGQRLSEEFAAAGRRIQETLGPESPIGRKLAELDAIALDGLRRAASGVMRGRPAQPEADRES
ncbi:MAG: type II toxin-antitoxin system HicB family antitoxin [Caulobacteraceae bacterium]|nr:type II toxin-antitoxin system HicB family antitoxin [Caulobacter sp.]